MLPLQPQGAAGGGSTLGTPTPSDYLFIYSNPDQTQITQELADSPEIERAEQATFSHTFRTSWQNCLVLIPMLSRGVFVQDSLGNIWRILSAKIQHDRGTWGKLTVVAESISFDSPPDDYQISAEQLGINIIKHPRYFWALNPSPNNPVDGGNDYVEQANVGDPSGAFWTVAQVKAAVIRAIQNYIDSPFQPNANQVASALQLQFTNALAGGTVPMGTAGQQPIITSPVALFAIAAAGEIIQKLWKNIDTPYLPGWRITWVQYYFAPAFLNPGAYIESPVGIVPDYFLDPYQGTNGSHTIFDQMAAINPQAFSDNGYPGGTVEISWLRQSDEQEYQRTWFAIKMSWIGSAIGTWDTEIFSANPRPNHQLYDQTGVLGFLPLPGDNANTPIQN